MPGEEEPAVEDGDGVENQGVDGRSTHPQFVKNGSTMPSKI